LIAAAAAAILYTVFKPPKPAPPKDAYDIFQDSREALRHLESAEFEVRSFLMLTHGNEQRSITETGQVRQQGTEENLTLEADVTLDYSGSESRQRAYFAGGILYRDYRGQKIRTPMSYTEAYTALRMPDLALERAVVTESSIVAFEDGGRKVTLTLDAGAIRALLAERIAPWVSDAGLLDAEIRYRDARFEMYLDGEGFLTSQELRFGAEIAEAGGEEAEMLVSLTLNVRRIGGVTVTLPGDLSSYPA
jgi:hypothetical protein